MMKELMHRVESFITFDFPLTTARISGRFASTHHFYQQVVFSRWFLWLALMLFLSNLYKFSIHLSDNQKEIKLQLLENEGIRMSWNYLYIHTNKGVKRLMDSAYAKITSENTSLMK